jgi:hypothetical protein
MWPFRNLTDIENKMVSCVLARDTHEQNIGCVQFVSVRKNVCVVV